MSLAEEILALLETPGTGQHSCQDKDSLRRAALRLAVTALGSIDSSTVDPLAEGTASKALEDIRTELASTR